MVKVNISRDVLSNFGIYLSFRQKKIKTFYKSDDESMVHNATFVVTIYGRVWTYP